MRKLKTYLLVLVFGFLSTFSARAYEYVDLGLPSGTLWATMNIGATTTANSRSSWGTYFRWGNTTSTGSNYISSVTTGGRYDGTTTTTLTKYNTKSSYGTVDSKTELEVSDDAAYVNWGTTWRVPTKEQWEELFEFCSKEWDTVYDTDYGSNYRIKLMALTATISIFLRQGIMMALVTNL